MRNSIVTRCCTLATAIVVVCLCGPARAADETTVKVFAAWQGQGITTQTGAQQATFVGALVGRMYVDTDKGPLESGMMACPAIIEIGLEDGSQRGQGRCTITAKDGAQIYAEIACTGVHMIGCNGDLKLTGGTERFKGVTGGGKLVIRSEVRLIATKGDRIAAEEGAGILYVRELSYNIPSPAK